MSGDAERAVREAHEAVESMRGWEENDDQRVSNAHAAIDHAIEAVRRDEGKGLADRLEKRAAEITWEPPASERRNYWPMNAVKYELGREVADIRARIGKEGE